MLAPIQQTSSVNLTSFPPIRALTSLPCLQSLTQISDHAKIFQNIVYTTGQIGGDVDGRLVSENVEEQAEQMFRNLEAILTECGSGLERVLSANIFLVDEGDYGAFNEVYLKVSCIFFGLRWLSSVCCLVLYSILLSLGKGL